MNYRGWEITLDNSRGCGYQNAVRATLCMGGEFITHYWENFCGCIHYLRAISDNEKHIEQFKKLSTIWSM